MLQDRACSDLSFVGALVLKKIKERPRAIDLPIDADTFLTILVGISDSTPIELQVGVCYYGHIQANVLFKERDMLAAKRSLLGSAACITDVKAVGFYAKMLHAILTQQSDGWPELLNWTAALLCPVAVICLIVCCDLLEPGVLPTRLLLALSKCDSDRIRCKIIKKLSEIEIDGHCFTRDSVCALWNVTIANGRKRPKLAGWADSIRHNIPTKYIKIDELTF
jgi:hypothetical protein